MYVYLNVYYCLGMGAKGHHASAQWALANGPNLLCSCTVTRKRWGASIQGEVGVSRTPAL